MRRDRIHNRTIKNQQIATQTDLLKGLSERLREGNILMGSLQTQLTLSEGSTRTSAGVVDSSTTLAQTEKGREPPASSPPKKSSLFGRLFR